MSRMALRAGSLTLALGLLFAIGLWGGTAGSAPAGNGDGLVGQDLINALGLELQTKRPHGCEAYVEVNDPAGYCVDEHVSSDREFFELAARIHGAPRSELDMRIYDLVAELAEISETDDPERYEELSEQLSLLWEQKASE
jgi:hypothetical protein